MRETLSRSRSVRRYLSRSRHEDQQQVEKQACLNGQSVLQLHGDWLVAQTPSVLRSFDELAAIHCPWPLGIDVNVWPLLEDENTAR
jgi:hypothetical protein